MNRIKSLMCAVAALTALAAPMAGAEGATEGFDALLRDHVKDGVVDYPGIAANKSFNAFLDSLGAPAKTETKAGKLAYWINAYNAFSIKGILDGRSPSGFLGRQLFFKRAKYKLAGEETTLDNLEHKMIRPLGEPRIHFAVVCASFSCPKLRAEAYTEQKLEAQLQAGAVSFINDPSRNRFDKAGKTAYLSEIFKWFKDDFSAGAGSVEKFVAKYLNDPEIARDLEQGNYKIKYIDYDWSLNGVPPKS
jgi:hypothetical protein